MISVIQYRLARSCACSCIHLDLTGCTGAYQVSDNSGAKIAQCIQQSGRSWGIGDTITVAIKKAAPRGAPAAALTCLFTSRISAGGMHGCPPAAVREFFLPNFAAPVAGKVAAGSVHKAVIVETKSQVQRRDGSVLKFHKNACVLVSAKVLKTHHCSCQCGSMTLWGWHTTSWTVPMCLLPLMMLLMMHTNLIFISPGG